jgi:hypothetical protein
MASTPSVAKAANVVRARIRNAVDWMRACRPACTARISSFGSIRPAYCASRRAAGSRRGSEPTQSGASAT